MNDEMIDVDIETNRRYFSRAKTKTHVYIIRNSKRITCTAVNLSSNGVGLVSDISLGLNPGMICNLTFVLNLNGNILKLHQRVGRVVHITNGITGFIMDNKGIR